MINICICFDNNYFNLGIKLIKSILNTTNNKNQLKFNILVDKNEFEKLDEEFKINFKNIKYEIKEFIPSNKLIQLIEKQKERYELKNNKVKNPHPYYNYLNYARFYLNEYFPNLDKIIFLDADIIFHKPIENIFNNTKLDNNYFGAVSTKAIFNKWAGNLNYPGLPNFNLQDNQFNAGLFITLLSKWKENDITAKLENLIEKNNNWYINNKITFIYKTGTQPPLNLLFYKNIEIINNNDTFKHFKGYKKKIICKYIYIMSRLADFYNNKDDTINSYDLKNKFIIQYKNNCEYAIKVNLDDQPFCDCTSLTIGSDGNPICNGISQNCKQGFDQDSQLDKYKIHCEPSVDTCPSGNICNRDNLLCTSNYCICGTSKNLEENVGLKYMSEAWNLNVGKFFITSKLNNFQLTPSPSTRFQVLQPGEIWVIVPPHDSNNKPFWCFSQKQKMVIIKMYAQE